MQLRKNFSNGSVKNVFESEDLGYRDICCMATEIVKMRKKDGSKALTAGVKKLWKISY